MYYFYRISEAPRDRRVRMDNLGGAMFRRTLEKGSERQVSCLGGEPTSHKQHEGATAENMEVVQGVPS